MFLFVHDVIKNTRGWWTFPLTLAALWVPCFRIFCVFKNCTGWWTFPLPYILLMYTSTHTRSLLGALFLYIWGIYQFKRLMDIPLTLVALWVPCKALQNKYCKAFQSIAEIEKNCKALQRCSYKKCVFKRNTFYVLQICTSNVEAFLQNTVKWVLLTVRKY